MKHDIQNALSILYRLNKSVLPLHAISGILYALTAPLLLWVLSQVMTGVETQTDAAGLIYFVLWGTSAVALLWFAYYVVSKYRNQADGHMYMDIQIAKGKRSLAMDYQQLDSKTTNEIRQQIQKDRSQGDPHQSVIRALRGMCQDICGLIIALVLVWPLFASLQNAASITMTIIFLVGLLIVTLMAIRYNRKTQTRGWALLTNRSKRGEIYWHLLFGGISPQQGKDVRVYKAQQLIGEHMHAHNSDSWRNNHRIARVFALGEGTTAMVTGFIQGAAYLYVTLQAVSGNIGIGQVFLYAGAIYQLAGALTDLLSEASIFSLACGRMRSTIDYLNIPDEMYAGTIPVEKRRDNNYRLEFRNVSFQYPGSDTYALKNFSLDLRIGEKLAVVGMNGSGKTTMIKLLCRLYDPTEGEICLNGIDIRKYDYQDYLRIFSVVFQDFQLFAFPLGQNVAASTQVDTQKAQACLQEAGLGARLDTMPQGLDTMLYKTFDDNGVEVSGGEAQKIALARALYKDAPFIVLDEPTAALDPLAEYEIYSKFDTLVGGKTAVYISHRLSSCRFCQDIAVFHEGRLVQRGSHDTLLQDTQGKYAELWYAQAQYYEDAPVQ